MSQTGSAWASRLGPRTNPGAANNASWIVALGILAVVIPASEKVAANEVFFAAHGVSPLAWVAVLVVVVGLAWLVLFGVLAVLRRVLSDRSYDIVATSITTLVAWFLIGNILARTLFAGLPAVGWLLALVLAVVLALLARRLAMGIVLVVFAGVAAAIPLVLSVTSGGQDSGEGTFAFTEDGNRPSVLWVVSDELQYPLAFDADGKVRPEFPNLSALQQQSTTYTKAYSAANYTDYAVPSMLSGISDVAGVGADRMQDVRASIGIVPGLSSEYSVVMESPIYSFDCDSADCASVGSDDVGVIERYLGFARDTAAIAGRTALAPPFADFFPSLDGKWRDFWSGGDEFGDDAEGNSVQAVIDGINQVTETSPQTPFLAFWHTIRTHAPWVVDRQGVPIFPARVPIVDGAHMVGSEANQTYTTDELKYLQRRLYANAAVDFDRQLGRLIDDLKASGRYDDTLIIVTADHGATMTDRADRRVGDTLEQRWSEVAHVPLMVKEPGQTEPELVTEPRSTGQIAATVMDAAGATPGPGLQLSPALGSSLASGPVFTTVGGGVLTPWVYDGTPEVDPWRQEDLTPPDPQHPFAVGIDPSWLGEPVPDGWATVDTRSVQALPGESDQQVVIVDRDPTACRPDETVGLVTVGDQVVGSVLWEGPEGSVGGLTRGWAIVPASDPQAYRFWCQTS